MRPRVTQSDLCGVTLESASSALVQNGEFKPGPADAEFGETVLDTGDCAGFKAGEPDGHHLQNRGEATAMILEVGTRSPGPHAEYPDIDLRVTALGYVRKDGPPYS
jgi:uncharacterized cupin superfamily protein